MKTDNFGAICLLTESQFTVSECCTEWSLSILEKYLLSPGKNTLLQIFQELKIAWFFFRNKIIVCHFFDTMKAVKNLTEVLSISLLFLFSLQTTTTPCRYNICRNSKMNRIQTTVCHITVKSADVTSVYKAQYFSAFSDK
jgi:hypothetical protein